MSRSAKLTLVGTSCFAVGIVIFVHYAQQLEKSVIFPKPFFIYNFNFSSANAFSGHARWCIKRYGAAENQEGTESRF